MHKPILKEFLKYVFLNIAGQVAYSCYTLADTFFVSAKTGADGLTALNLGFPVFCLMNGISLMIAIGGGTRYALAKSQNNHHDADCIFTNSVLLSTIFALIFFLGGLFFSQPLVTLLGADESVADITEIYLKTLMLFAPAFFANTLFQSFVRNDGHPSNSTAAMITGSVSNIILDYIFIFPLGMGIFGAAFATGLSPVISLIVLSPYFIKKANQFHLTGLTYQHLFTGKIIGSGIPSLLTEAASGIVMFLFNFIILRISGNIGVAAFGVITVISLVVTALYTGLSQGIQPLLSRHYGIGNRMNVKKLRKYSMITTLLLSLIIYSIIFINADLFVSVFNSEANPTLQLLAVDGMRIYFLACPLIGFNIVFSTYYSATDKPVPAQIISLLRSFIILIPTAFILSHLLEMTGVWYAYPVTEGIVAVIAIGIMIKDVQQL